jgi:uncharacterized protein (TIGR02186 family)
MAQHRALFLARAWLAAALAGLLLPATALAQRVPGDTPLATDLSAHLIAITSSFTGTDLLLFGSVEEPGDIVVVVRGPAGPTVVRRKSRVGGIWLNTDSLEFENVPGYYAIAATRPIEEIASPGLLQRLQIGADNLQFRPRREASKEQLEGFREAMIRIKGRESLYQEAADPVTFLGRKLFRTRIGFPSTVPVGTYRAEVYLIRDDRVIAAQATPLFVNKEGVEQAVFDFAHRQPLFYGLAAVAAAVFAGWLAATMFRKA